MIKDTNYYTVCGWMLNRLHLKGNDLTVYAVINSFSQDGKSEFKGSNSYLADFTGAGERTISRILAELENRKLIEKTDDNASTGQFNGWRIVPLEQLEELGIIPQEGDRQNGDPPSPEWQPPGRQKRNPTVDKMATPLNKVDNNISNSNLNDINLDIEKESKKVSRKEGSYKPSACVRESYDEIIEKYDLSDEVRSGVGECIQHCALNDHRFTNKALIGFLDALITYPAQQRLSAIRRFIGGKTYVLEPYADKHYNFAGQYDSSRDYQNVMECFLKDYLGDNANFVFQKIWEFIQHCSANGQKMTNNRLTQLCLKLKKLYRPSEAVEMRNALDKAINGGYYDIKDGEGWMKRSFDMARVMGIELPEFGDDEDCIEDDSG